MAVDNIEDFHALEPFSRVIENRLARLVNGGHFFDLPADDVVFEFIITVPERSTDRRTRQPDRALPRLPQGILPRSLLRPQDPPGRRLPVTLEYASEGKAVVSGRPYSNPYISVVTIKDRKITHWRDYLDPLRVFAALDLSEVISAK